MPKDDDAFLYTYNDMLKKLNENSRKAWEKIYKKYENVPSDDEVYDLDDLLNITQKKKKSKNKRICKRENTDYNIPVDDDWKKEKIHKQNKKKFSDNSFRFTENSASENDSTYYRPESINIPRKEFSFKHSSGHSSYSHRKFKCSKQTGVRLERNKFSRKLVNKNNKHKESDQYTPALDLSNQQEYVEHTPEPIKVIDISTAYSKIPKKFERNQNSNKKSSSSHNKYIFPTNSKILKNSVDNLNASEIGKFSYDNGTSSRLCDFNEKNNKIHSLKSVKRKECSNNHRASKKAIIRTENDIFAKQDNYFLTAEKELSGISETKRIHDKSIKNIKNSSLEKVKSSKKKEIGEDKHKPVDKVSKYKTNGGSSKSVGRIKHSNGISKKGFRGSKRADRSRLVDSDNFLSEELNKTLAINDKTVSNSNSTPKIRSEKRLFPTNNCQSRKKLFLTKNHMQPIVKCVDFRKIDTLSSEFHCYQNIDFEACAGVAASFTPNSSTQSRSVSILSTPSSVSRKQKRSERLYPNKTCSKKSSKEVVSSPTQVLKEKFQTLSLNSPKIGIPLDDIC